MRKEGEGCISCLLPTSYFSLLTSYLSLLTSDLSLLFPHQHQNRRLGDDQIFLVLEGDLDRRLAEEDRVIADPGLHAPGLGFPGVHFPGLVVEAKNFDELVSLVEALAPDVIAANMPDEIRPYRVHVEMRRDLAVA